MDATVLVVDDQPMTRLGVHAALEREEGITVVGETGDSQIAPCLAGELAPDLVLMELRMHGEMAGATLCGELKAAPDPPRVLIHTARNSHRDVYSCYLAGADGFVHKGEEPRRLVDAVRQVASGKRVWLLGGEPEQNAPGTGDAASDPLTEKEGEVLALVLRGHSNAGIAEHLCLSRSTVKTHMSHIFSKLGVSGREGLFSPRNGTPASRP